MSVHKHNKYKKYMTETDTKGLLVQNTDSIREGLLTGYSGYSSTGPG